MNHDLLQLVARFTGRRVLLVGDFMLDSYIIGDAERISPEAPVPVLRKVEQQDRVGGAGSVALNVVALGANVRCFGLLGKDSFGDRVEQLLREQGADTRGLIRVADRPTITKTRVLARRGSGPQQLVRIDCEERRPAAAADRDHLLRLIQEATPKADAVCLQDYAKGVLCEELCRAVIAEARRHNKPVLVDPARLGEWSKYQGATLLKPNRDELEAGAGRQLVDDAQIDDACRGIIDQLELEAVVVTLGDRGARLVRRGAGEAAYFPACARRHVDHTGAGDATLAALSLGVAAGAPLERAVPLANLVGGLEVRKLGCVPVTLRELRDELEQASPFRRHKIRTPAELIPELQTRRRAGQTVVFTNGVFDLLHPGHVELLARAKGFGDLLVVGLNSDDSVRTLGKGDDRPLRSQDVRARMLAALEAVDYVVIFDEPDPLRLIEELAPDVLVKGGDYAREEIVGHHLVERRGGRVEVVALVESFSTSDELERIRSTFASGFDELRPTLDQIADALIRCFRANGHLYLFGNGGSAAHAQHIAAELVGRFKRDRRALPAKALTTDTSLLTAIGNDLGFETVFSRQLEAFVRPGDMVWALSTSGNSPNVLAGVRTAVERGATAIGFTGARGGKLAQLCTYVLLAPYTTTDRIQEAHALAYHYVCERVEEALKE